MFELTAGAILKRLAEFAGSAALEQLQSHKGAATARLTETRDALAFQAVLELQQLLAQLLRRMTKLEAEQVRRRYQHDHESLGILANYFEDLHQEPLDERRRMLVFASLTLANLHLTVSQLARVQRVIRELDPRDTFVLHGLLLIPAKAPWKKDRTAPTSQGAVRLHYWRRSPSDALIAAGAALLTTTVPTTPGQQGALELMLTETATLLLRAFRPFLLQHSPGLGGVPWHEVGEEARSRIASEPILAAVPEVQIAIAACIGPGFSKRITYSCPAVALGARVDGKARLVLRGDSTALAPLEELSQGRKIQEGTPVTDIWVDSVTHKSPGESIASIDGPHDVLRWLAYEASALWV